LRRGFYEFLNDEKIFYDSVFKTENKRILFCTYQTPITIKKPFNGFYKIFREVFQYLFLYFDEKVNIKTFKNKPDNYDSAYKESNKEQASNSSRFKKFNEEIISIIVEEKCFYLIKYLEMILKKDLMTMFEHQFKQPSIKEETQNKNNNLNDNNNLSNNENKTDAEVLSYTPDILYTFNRSN